MSWLDALLAIVNLLVAVVTLMKLIQTHNTFNSKMDEAIATAKLGAAAQATLNEKQAQTIRDAERVLTQAERDATVIK